MPGLSATTTSKDLPDSSIRVVISPSQSSYFAGEPFSVTITFTNTRLPDAPSNNASTPSSSRPNGYTHRRGAHSISSAPLARPPTSPGTPRSALNQPPPPPPSASLGKSKGLGEDVLKRKGFIGRTNRPTSGVESTATTSGSTSAAKTIDDLPELLEQRRRKQLAPKSLSVSISPMELESLADGGVISSAPYSQPGFFSHDGRTSSTAPHVSSPLVPLRGRSRTEPVPPHHPHARKHSVLDGQFTLDMISPTTSNPPAPYSPSSSTSTFSLALDPIVEGTYSPYPSTPAIGSPTIEPAALPPTPVGYYSHSYLEQEGQVTPTATSTANSLNTAPPSAPGHSPYAYPPARPQGRHGHTQSTSFNSNASSNPRALGLGHPSSQKLAAGGGSHPYGNVPKSAFASTFSQQSHPSTPPPQPPHSASIVPNYPYGQHHPYAPHNTHAHPASQRKTSSTSLASSANSELILYSYAQLTGTLTLTPVAGAQGTPDQIRQMARVRSALLSRNVVGGGSMDITRAVSSPGGTGLGLGGYGYGGLGSPSLGSAPVAGGVGSVGSGGGPGSAAALRSPRHRQGHSRTSSFSAGLLAMLSPSSLLSGSSSASPSSPSPHQQHPPPPPLSSQSSSSTEGGSRSSSGGWGSPLIGSPSGGSLAKRRSTSSNASTLSGSPKGSSLGSGASPSLGSAGVDLMGLNISPDEPLPAFEVQPAMLGVDLSLGPGESRSYTYTLKLPDVLPPTFKGKSLVFSYELVVGICRAGGGGSVAANSVSKVMKVPIRVYNHVCVGKVLKPYDLLWPAHRRMDVNMPANEAKVVEVSSKEVMERSKRGSKGQSLNGTGTSKATTAASSPETNTLEALKEYANSLLGSFAQDRDGGERNGVMVLGTRPAPPPALSRQQSEAREREEEGGLTGCREAVEILTRNPKKASYDVNKDGVKVAVLAFAKSAYRLGETICGVVEINERMSRARVLKLTAVLESHESLPSTIAPASASRHLRRSHAEHHASFTLNTLRTTFSLDIPSDASPAFQIRVGTPPLTSPGSSAPQPSPGGLEWRVRLCLLVSIAQETSYTSMQGIRFKSLLREGTRGEWGSSWRATTTLAPLERPDLKAQQKAKKESVAGLKSPSLLRSPVVASAKSWSQFFVSSLLYGTTDPSTEREYHDGDALDSDDETGDQSRGDGLLEDGYDGIIADPAGGVGTGIDYACGEEEGVWQESRLEMVECEVPVKIFPGNTAFKALDVVFAV